MKNIFLVLALFALISCSQPAEEPAEKQSEAPAPKEQTPIEMTAEAQSHIGLQVCANPVPVRSRNAIKKRIHGSVTVCG